MMSLWNQNKHITKLKLKSIDRTGFSVGTLHEESSPAVKQIEMPKSRPRSLLTMEDMGMSHDMSSMKVWIMICLL